MADSSESPYSATYSLKDKEGLPLLFTIRGNTFKEMMDKITEAKMVFKSDGYTGNEKKGFAPKEKEYVEGRTCPKCGGKLLKVVTSKGNAIKCENGRYNPTTKSTDGCNFFEWQNSTSPTVPTVVQSSDGIELATQPQKNLIMSKFPELWIDGMTKQQATEVIRTNLAK
jgi:hypothetical protein